jgi:hypothetical protein
MKKTSNFAIGTSTPCAVTPAFAPPRGRARLLRLFAGDLSGLHPDWTGFRFHGEKLRGPDGEWITPGMLRAYPHLERALHTAMSTKSVLLSL